MMYIHKLHALIDWAFPNDQIKQSWIYGSTFGIKATQVLY